MTKTQYYYGICNNINKHDSIMVDKKNYKIK